jgi:hypothetical protein
MLSVTVSQSKVDETFNVYKNKSHKDVFHFAINESDIRITEAVQEATTVRSHLCDSHDYNTMDKSKLRSYLHNVGCCLLGEGRKAALPLITCTH